MNRISSLLPRCSYKNAAFFAVTLFLAGATARDAAAQSATTMSQVKTVFARRANGNAFFNQRLRAELQARGLRFVSSPRGADAFLDSAGRYVRGGFRGQMTFIGRGGRVLLRESVLRKTGSNTMAFQTLARKVR